MSKVLDKWILNQYFSDFVSHESPGILLDGDAHSEGLEWGLRAHVLHQLSVMAFLPAAESKNLRQEPYLFSSSFIRLQMGLTVSLVMTV